VRWTSSVLSEPKKLSIEALSKVSAAGTAIARQLAVDGCAVPAKLGGDCADAQAGFTQLEQRWRSSSVSCWYCLPIVAPS
jgi:hypothetical protein